MKVKKYNREDLTVLWQPELCSHSGVCVRGLGEVFDPKKRPWIDLNRATKDVIRDQVRACPSGALSLDAKKPAAAGEPPANQIIHVEAIPNGPLKLTSTVGQIQVGGEVYEGKACFLCRCGASGNKPYCDGSHKKAGFQAE